MKKYALPLCGLAFAMLLSTPVFADTMYDFSFTGNNSVSGSPGIPFSGSGVFDVKATRTSGEFRIVGVSGMTDGETISKLLSAGSFGFNDNLLFVTNGVASLDNSGVSYQLANGVDANIFLGVPGQYQQSLFGFPGSLVSEDQTANVSITSPTPSVPEPSTLMLLATGAVGLAGTIRRRLVV